MKENKTLWQRFSGFFEHGDLAPFAVIVSAWHFVEALRSQGELWFIATAQGVLVDMLHFRTVRYAVRSKTWGGVFIASITTLISFGFHLLFYGHDGFQWLDLLLATPLPIGIPILAWLGETNALQTVDERVEGALKEREEALNIRESTMSQLEADLKARDETINSLREALKSERSRVNELKKLKTMLESVNPLVQDLMKVMAFGGMTQEQIAKKHEVSAGHVSGLKAKLNGHR